MIFTEKTLGYTNVTVRKSRSLRSVATKSIKSASELRTMLSDLATMLDEIKETEREIDELGNRVMNITDTNYLNKLNKWLSQCHKFLAIIEANSEVVQPLQQAGKEMAKLIDEFETLNADVVTNVDFIAGDVTVSVQDIIDLISPILPFVDTEPKFRIGDEVQFPSNVGASSDNYMGRIVSYYMDNNGQWMYDIERIN